MGAEKAWCVDVLPSVFLSLHFFIHYLMHFIISVREGAFEFILVRITFR